jgi:hypothetical protein
MVNSGRLGSLKKQNRPVRIARLDGIDAVSYHAADRTGRPQFKGKHT